MRFRVCVTKYGYADIKANDEDEALEIAINKMNDHEFDWSDFDEAEVVEELEDWYNDDDEKEFYKDLLMEQQEQM